MILVHDSSLLTGHKYPHRHNFKCSPARVLDTYRVHETTCGITSHRAGFHLLFDGNSYYFSARKNPYIQPVMDMIYEGKEIEFKLLDP